MGEALSDCPKARGIVIFGSSGDDEIKGGKGPDLISCGKGKDIVREAQKSDEIAGSCEKVRRA